jgi:hypothetical protein
MCGQLEGFDDRARNQYFESGDVATKGSEVINLYSVNIGIDLSGCLGLEAGEAPVTLTCSVIAPTSIMALIRVAAPTYFDIFSNGLLKPLLLNRNRVVSRNRVNTV